MKSATLTPAYGRDYKNRAAVEADFHADKDFVFEPHRVYANKSDLVREGVDSVTLRYGALRKACVVRLPAKGETP